MVVCHNSCDKTVVQLPAPWLVSAKETPAASCSVAELCSCTVQPPKRRLIKALVLLQQLVWFMCPCRQLLMKCSCTMLSKLLFSWYGWTAKYPPPLTVQTFTDTIHRCRWTYFILFNLVFLCASALSYSKHQYRPCVGRCVGSMHMQWRMAMEPVSIPCTLHLFLGGTSSISEVYTCHRQLSGIKHISDTVVLEWISTYPSAVSEVSTRPKLFHPGAKFCSHS
jgi:hypothetical protein